MAKDDRDRARWANAEKFFSRSWTHAFYSWKLRQLMLGRTVSGLLGTSGVTHRLRVIDLGCGPGSILFEIHDACRDIARVDWFGLDLNVGEVTSGASRSHYRVKERGMHPVHFMAGDVLNLPFADNSLDIIVSSEVIEHLPDPRSALQEMARVLRPGGYAMLTTPNPQNLPERVGYFLDRISGGRFKRFYWQGEDTLSAPPLSAAVGFGHVSVHPFHVWRGWLQEVGMPVVRKVRGPMLFGSPFFDRQRWLCGLLIALDPILDRLPGRFLTTTNLGMLCRKDSGC